MKKYLVEKFVDYLSFTSFKANISGAVGSKHYQWIKSPIANYNQAIQYSNGLIELSHSVNKKIGTHFIASGSALKYIRENQMSEREFLAHALEIGQISRIDIAITSVPDDFSEHELKPTEITQLCIDGKLKSRMKDSKEISHHKNIETKYIGNQKTRRRLFRAYDKGLEDGGEAARIVRYELETRRGGNVVARAVRDGTDIGALMRRYVDFDSELWHAIVGSDIAKIKQDTGEITVDFIEQKRLERLAKWNWLNESIAPLIKRLIAENKSLDDITIYENEFIAEFKRLSGL